MCFEEGLWQAYLDQELEPHMHHELERHLKECPHCRGFVSELQRGQEYLNISLQPYRLQTEKLRFSTTAGWERFTRKNTSKSFVRKGLYMMSNIPRKVVAAIMITAVAGSLTLTPVRSAAAQFLQVFRAEKITTVTLSMQDIERMRSSLSKGVGEVDLKDYGKIVLTGKRESETVAMSQLKEKADFPVNLPSFLPQGYTNGEARISSSFSTDFTLNVENFNKLIQALGGENLLPPGISGKTLSIAVPQMVSITYYNEELKSRINISQGKSPQLNVPDNVDINGVREALLSLPILPLDLKRQLAGIDDWQHTIIVPNVEGNVRDVTIAGAQGVFIEHGPSSVEVTFREGDGPGSPGREIEYNGNRGAVRENGQVGGGTLIWQKNGIFYVVNGPLDLAAAQEIALSMR